MEVKLLKLMLVAGAVIAGGFFLFSETTDDGQPPKLREVSNSERQRSRGALDGASGEADDSATRSTSEAISSRRTDRDVAELARRHLASINDAASSPGERIYLNSLAELSCSDVLPSAQAEAGLVDVGAERREAIVALGEWCSKVLSERSDTSSIPDPDGDAWVRESTSADRSLQRAAVEQRIRSARSASDVQRAVVGLLIYRPEGLARSFRRSGVNELDVPEVAMWASHSTACRLGYHDCGPNSLLVLVYCTSNGCLPQESFHDLMVRLVAPNRMSAVQSVESLFFAVRAGQRLY